MWMKLKGKATPDISHRIKKKINVHVCANVYNCHTWLFKILVVYLVKTVRNFSNILSQWIIFLSKIVPFYWEQVISVSQNSLQYSTETFNI